MSNNKDNILNTFVVDTTTAKVEIEGNVPFLIQEVGTDKHHSMTRKVKDSKVYEVSYTYDESKLKDEDNRHRWA